MGWGTILKEVYVSRVSPNEVEIRMEEEESLITMYRDDLMMLAAATPREVNDGDSVEPWEDYASRRVGEAIDGLMECAVRRYQFNLIKEADPNDIVHDA